MRLIDADAQREEFMEIVYEELADDPDNNRANRIIDFFDSMPVNYDLDRVVEEIKESYNACDSCKLYSMHECSAAHCQIKEIIDIVRRGGTDDGN